MKKDLFNLIKIITLGMVFSVGVNYLFAWTGNNNPPIDNITESTINISNTQQSKGGSIVGDYLLHINGLLSVNDISIWGLSIFDGDFKINGLTKVSVDTLCANSSGQIIYCPSPATPVAPTVTIGYISNQTSSGATSGGEVTSDGGSTVFERGVVWGTTLNPLPTITANSHTSDGAGTGVYSSTITGLNPSTTYYLRAYATNSVGTSYSSLYRIFTTLASPNLLQVSKTGIAASNGTITSNTGGINCGTNCQQFYTAGASVILSATATSGSFLSAWTGCTSTSGTLPNQTCSVAMNSSVKTVTASFITCNGQYRAGYCWYKANLNQSCNSFCSSHGSCISPYINYTIETQVCSALSMGYVQQGSGNISPRTDNASNCYVQGFSSTPTNMFTEYTCGSAYNMWQANACACAR